MILPGKHPVFKDGAIPMWTELMVCHLYGFFCLSVDESREAVPVCHEQIMQKGDLIYGSEKIIEIQHAVSIAKTVAEKETNK